jgi:D-erythro-7,8-dihydroneopterin triphosphate epimerase
MTAAETALQSVELIKGVPVDRIRIRDLSVRCIIGVDEEERRQKQDVIINIAISTDLRRPGRSDDFAEALDYSALKKEVVALVENSRRRLLEALAEDIAGLCLAAPAVKAVRVTVDKPGALRFARSVAVEIVRRRGE